MWVGWTCTDGHGGWTAPRLFEWFEKKPLGKEDWCVSHGASWDWGTEGSVVTWQPLSICLLIMPCGTLAWQMGHSTSTGSDMPSSTSDFCTIKITILDDCRRQKSYKSIDGQK